MEYIFNYKIEGKTTLSARFGRVGDVIAYMTLSFFIIVCLVSTFLALTEDKNFIYHALFMFLFVLILGPYQIFPKRFYNFALKKDGTVVMKSIVNFIPRSYTFHAKDIAHIQLVRFFDIMFYDKQKRVIGMFNCLILAEKQKIVEVIFNSFMLVEKQLLESIEHIKKFNPDLVVNLS